MEDITLGEIKAYCEEKGIELVPNKKDPTVYNGIQTFGDINAETYFHYYVTHSVEIEEWRKNKGNFHNEDINENVK